jgi:hypothetical protein
VSHLSVGERNDKRGNLRLRSPFIGEGERERERGGNRGPARRRQDASGLSDWLDHSVVSGPLSRVSNWWPSVGFSNLARAQISMSIVHQSGLLTIGFLFFQTELNL